MNPRLDSLLLVIVSLTSEMGGYVTKTKLLKLLYLFDVEYYRVHRQTFTGLDWEYYLLGPWASQYDPLLDRLASNGDIYKYQGSNPDNDTEFIKANKQVPIKEALPNFQDESILRRVLNVWSNKRTAKILDYVYFQTEPILHGERYQALDFSLIPEQPIPQYRRSSSGKTKQQIKNKREAFEEKQKAKTQVAQRSHFTTPPKYDDEYWEGMEILEELAR